MKIAISANNKTSDGEVDPRFGRASYFAIYETDTNALDFVNNDQNMNAPSGAGIQAAQNVIATGAKAVITGNCGPKAFKTLNAAGVKIITGASGTIKETIERYKKGELKEAEAANVDGHW